MRRRRVPPLPADLVVRPLHVGGEELLVFSWRLGERPSLPDEPTLTPAERAVGELLLDGRSDAAIAAERGTSVRTVSKQAASLYRKLGVSSRRELWARCTTGAHRGRT